MADTELRERLAALVGEATAGEVAAAEVLTGDSLIALGVDSLALLRLVDAIELEYGVEIDLAAAPALDTLDDLVALLTATRPAPAADQA
ncbi:acyl carrier protein [Micromonospora sp. DT229]|uniref:acyl carrier protein n=1 Tax=Micromonospora sp. DT229 TaxID=3393430 RepID=UPI003CEA5302